MTATLFEFPEPTPRRRPSKPKKEPQQRYSARFESAWLIYPRKLNCSKFEASKAFEKLPDNLQEQCLAALPIFARICVGKDEQYICHMATWINQRRFETIVVTESTIASEINWPNALKIYRATGRWNVAFGPEPGQPGYLGPFL